MRYLRQCPEAGRFVLMMQREVAGRLSAAPGSRDYGALSVMVQFYANVQNLFDVSPACFYPKPDVVSTVALLVRRAPAVLPRGRSVVFPRRPGVFCHAAQNAFKQSIRHGRFGKTGRKSRARPVPAQSQRAGETLETQAFIALSNAVAQVLKAGG